MCRFPLRISPLLVLATALTPAEGPRIDVDFAAAIPSGPVYVGRPVDLISTIKVTSPVDMDRRQLMALPGFSPRVTWTAAKGVLSAPVDTSVMGDRTRPPGGIVFVHRTTYVPPAAPGTYTLVASPAADPSRSVKLEVTVEEPPVRLIPASITLDPGQRTSFSVARRGPDQAELRWSATGGTITAQGLYTAPAAEGTYLIQVEDESHPDARATASVRVVPLSLTLRPAQLTLGANQPAQFHAAANRGGWTWSANGGKIDENGLYQAPMDLGSYQVTVQSTLDPARRATANVTVVTPLALSIVPEEITLKPGQTFTFSLLGLPPDTRASWLVEPASAGIVSEAGVFTAGNRPGICSVMAVGEEMGASASVTIDNIRISPDPAMVVPGGNVQFTAAGFPPEAQISWTVRPAEAGIMSAGGRFTASSHSGPATVAANAGEIEATGVVQVLAARITPDPALVLPGALVQFACEVFGDSGPAVTWALVGDQPGASMSPGGSYIAPRRQGIYQVAATTAAGSAAQATVVVGPPSVLILAPEIEIQESRIYQVRVRLRASNGHAMESHWVGELKRGLAYPEVPFPAGALRQLLGADGPYAVDRIIVAGYVDDEVVEFDRREHLGMTQAFSLAESWQDWIIIGDIADSRGLDETGDGLLDKLVVTIPVEVVVAGEYHVRANLAAGDGRVIDSLAETLTWTPGTHQLSLAFDGRRIHASGLSGPLSITDLAVEGVVTREKEYLDRIHGYDFRMFRP